MVCGMVLEPGVVVVKVERSERYQDRNVYLSTLTVPRVPSTNIAYERTIFVIYFQRLFLSYLAL